MALFGSTDRCGGVPGRLRNRQLVQPNVIITILILEAGNDLQPAAPADRIACAMAVISASSARNVGMCWPSNVR